MHYLYKRSIFTDVVAACGGDGTCYVKNDRAGRPFNGTVTLESLAFADGAVSTVHTEEVSLGPGAGVSRYFHANNITALSGAAHMLIATVREDSTEGNGAVLSTNEIPLVPPKAMRLHAAVVAATLTPVPNTDGTFDVTLSATATALYITLTTLAHGRFSDNFFAMGAGSKRTIQFVPFSTFNLSMLAPSLRVEHLQMYLGSSAAGAEIL